MRGKNRKDRSKDREDLINGVLTSMSEASMKDLDIILDVRDRISEETEK